MYNKCGAQWFGEINGEHQQPIHATPIEVNEMELTAFEGGVGGVIMAAVFVVSKLPLNIALSQHSSAPRVLQDPSGIYTAASPLRHVQQLSQLQEFFPILRMLEPFPRSRHADPPLLTQL
mmetsp:Transcript_3311/g.7669  ORF Transcript_3311/g.7669 Transcript_3311/m.7669 type:complete len:120 (+) Transcript_3311:96-455(+)